MTHKKRFVLVCICVMFLVSMLCVQASADENVNTSKIGAWYSTWYAKTPEISGEWITGFGVDAVPYMGDVTGDGLEDAIAYKAGVWQVAASDGTAFVNPSTWIDGHGYGSDRQYVADVNGDGKADAIVAFNTDPSGDGQMGDWYVSLSNGTAFQNYTLWKSGQTIGNKAIFDDVNGDGKSDLVEINNGVWSVLLSTGTSFSNATAWGTNLAANADDWFLADFNADGKADAVSFEAAAWTVYYSTGSSFNTTGETKTAGHGYGSSYRFVEDANGDGYPDILVFFNSDTNQDQLAGDVYGRMSQNLSSAIDATDIVLNSGFGVNNNGLFVSMIRDNVDNYQYMVSYYAATGTWNVDLYHATKENIHDTWSAWDIDYVPYTLGQYRQYDSGETLVIQEHLTMCANAKIDFLLLDETNHLYVDDYYIYNRACEMTAAIQNWNAVSSNRRIEYAIAIGGIQWSHDPAEIESEANEVWNRFVTQYGSGNYFTVDGKPLLVVFCVPEDAAAWRNWTGDKTATNNFTVRFAHGPAQANNYGWQVANGSIPGDEVMVVMPGWNNNKGWTPVSRAKGNFYAQACWDVVLAQNTLPEIVLINSFNEYAEETAIAPTDTTYVSGQTEQWLNANNVMDNYMYWNMTIQYINQLLQES